MLVRQCRHNFLETLTAICSINARSYTFGCRLEMTSREIEMAAELLMKTLPLLQTPILFSNYGQPPVLGHTCTPTPPPPPPFRPFTIIVVKLAFYVPSNSRFTPKNAHIMLNSQNNATLVPENALFRFKQNIQTQAHVMGLSLYHCFLSSCTFHWLILKINLELSLKGLVYVLHQNFLL